MDRHHGADSRSVKDAVLRVSLNHRYLETGDGTPFFYLADTAWTLFKRLDHDDVDRYFQNRLDKGFTVIQAYVLRGLEMTNLYGDLPLVDRDPTRLNEAFFRNVDYVVERANELGLVMALVATQGEHVVAKAPTELTGQERFKPGEQIFDVDNAFEFGRILGKRFIRNNVIWLLGGDRNPQGHTVAIWDAMGRGFKAGSEGRALVSYHGGGATSSSTFFHDREWLDFNTIQSRHATADPNYLKVEGDYALVPIKPTLDMEARYEDYPDTDDPSRRMDAHTVREAAYWAVLAGGAGHGYGHNDIWQLSDPRKVDSTLDYSFPHKPPNHAWYESIDAPGAFGVSHMGRLMRLRPWYLSVPDQSVIESGQGDGEDHIQAARAADGSFVIAYLPFGHPVSVDLEHMTGTEVVGHWYDPRQGTFAPIGTFPRSGVREFRAPSSGSDDDWVLVLDDAAKGYEIGA